MKKYLKRSRVNVRFNSRVEKIIVSENKVEGVKPAGNNNIIKADKVILATGGLSYPVTGSTGDGYRMAEKLGHTIAPVKPALVPLETKETFVKELQGLTLKNVTASAYSLPSAC